jgi:photosystem II stability/assembly factor-like uncharacterized protein
VAFGAGNYVVVGAEGTILTSEDGVSWKPRTSGVTHFLKGATFARNSFWVAGWNGAILESGALGK